MGDGGWDGEQEISFDTVEEYAAGTWKTQAPMPTDRHGLSSSVVSGKIYVIGGAGVGLTFRKTVEEYDPETDTWMDGQAAMPTERYMHSASEVNGVIYAIGGTQTWPSTIGLSSVEAYDPTKDTFTTTVEATSWGRIKSLFK